MTEISLVLKCGDAFSLIRELPDESVDLVYTDMPYDCAFMPRLSDMQKLTICDEYRRVLKKSGSIALWCGDIDMFQLHKILTEMELNFVMTFGWFYNNPSGHPPQNRFMYAKENGIWFTKRKDNYFFQKAKAQMLNFSSQPAYGGFVRFAEKDGIPAEKLGVTPKPLDISYNIVRSLCPEGGYVLDAMAGLSTFAIPCIGYCNYIGYEIRKNVHEAAVTRVNKFMNNPVTNWFGGDNDDTLRF